ncbi:hypothetical protein [Cupriavidus metallidurans]|uniref:hypothetical protein n=1 Tax=Cupriavidus metallidurans TaxID=119219 RepID=UPI0005620729|nr:hypothetical protein [Cupriavidus metallidurans]
MALMKRLREENGDYRSGTLQQVYRAVIVAMVAVWMVKMTIDQIVNVIAVWHRFVPASGAVNMPGLMPPTVVVRRASVGILRTHFKSVLVDMARMWMVQMAVMQKIDVPVVPDCRMATVHAVPVMMMGMVRQVASAHA